jgi:hypothetical protein
LEGRAFVPAIRIMSGQKPKVNTIFFPLPIITNDDIDDYYDPSMTVQSTCFANGRIATWSPTPTSTRSSPAARKRRRSHPRAGRFWSGAAEKEANRVIIYCRKSETKLSLRDEQSCPL